MTRLILVLGMHRSGTSLITKSLECMGVSLGDNADWSGPDNPQGFWEDRDILAIDEAVLRRYGTTWDQPMPDTTPILSDLQAAATKVLGEKLRRWPLFGVKDPRMCRLLPFWKPVFERVGCEVGAVVVTRASKSISHSLMRRNGISERDAAALHTEHDLGILRGLDARWPYWQVGYEDFVADPVGELSDIADALDLPLDLNAAARFSTHYVRQPA